MTGSNSVPDLFLEQYVLGEASKDVVRRIEASEELLARADALREENEAFLRAVPPAFVLPKIKAAAGERAHVVSDRRQFIVPALAAAALVAALLPVYLTQREGDAAGVAAGERVKGLDPTVSVFRNLADAEAVELLDGDEASLGDVLQIVYSAAGAKFGVIFSVDGRGVVTLHHPANIFVGSDLEQGANVALPYSYVLDDSPSFERFIFIVSDSELSVGAIIERAEELAERDPRAVRAERFLADGVDADELTIVKSEELQ